MDEPTSGVDVRTRHEVVHLLADLNDDGLAMVLSTHDLNGIATHLPHIVCLNRDIKGSGSPREVLTPRCSNGPTGRRWTSSNTPGCRSSSTGPATGPRSSN